MPLRFDDLSPREFEELCLALLRAEGHADTRHVGAAGTDRGWDLRTTAPDGRVWCVQCKRVKNFSPGDGVRELNKVLTDGGDGGELPAVWTLMAACDLSAETEKELKKAAAGRLEIRLAGRSDLEGRLDEQRRIRDRFFAGDEPRARAVYLSAAKADRDFAAALRRDLQAALREGVGANWNVVWHDPTEDRGLPEVPANASWGLVVVSPEALADRRLLDLWQGQICFGHDTGRRQLLAVSTAPTVAWPSWLTDRFERVRLEPETYRIDLASIISKWIGTTESPPSLVGLELEGPVRREGRLDPEISEQLIDWLTPVMERTALRRLLAVSLGLDSKKALDDFETPALQASAAIALSRQDDDPVRAALRLIGVVRDELEDEESAARLAELDQLAEELSAVPPPAAAYDRGLLPAWLRKVQSDHERLVDYFQQRHELDLLDRVYVELELDPERFAAERAEGAKDPTQRLGEGPLGIEELLALDPAKHPWVTRRWIVKGDPGAGKTTLLRHLAAKLARAGLAKSEPPRWVPLFQSLPVLARSREPLLDRIERLMASQTGQGLGAVLDREGQEGRLVLLLDGLDEVGDHREAAEGLIRRLAEQWPATPIIVSTRPIGYRRFAQPFREVQLLPLDRPRRLTFLACWFGRADGSRQLERAEAALDQLESAGLEELAGNPLYLTLMAMLIEQKAVLTRNRAQLYDRVFQLLLEGKHKHDRVEPIERPDLVRQALRLLAWTMTLDNRDAEPSSALEERLYRDELETVRAELKKVARWDGPLRHFLADLSEKVGILGPHDGEDADWRFWHRTFKEALTSEHLATLPSATLLAHAGALADPDQESRWAEPYALLAGQVKDPDALVKELVKANRTLGLRAVATAQGLRDETLREILALNEQWQDRIKIYPQIPELVKDPPRALALLDQLRQRTRNGNDLFFLEQTVAAVGRESEEHRRLAELIRERFYDHIDLPPDELFRWIDTRDGRVDLWREIPAGSFQMGSPPEEEGDNDERPQHEVTVTSPFLLAAVPITHGQYLAFDPAHRSGFEGQIPADELKRHPVDSVTWYEAIAFCSWLSQRFPGARLPTEEEWEYACRAGTKTPYWSGGKVADLKRVGWYDKNSDERSHRVGEKLANPWGLYDVHGNVWEWTLSERSADYSKRQDGFVIHRQRLNPADLAGASVADRVLRGGGFWNDARWARAAYRYFWNPGVRFWIQGFRVLLPCRPEPSMNDPRS